MIFNRIVGFQPLYCLIQSQTCITKIINQQDVSKIIFLSNRNEETEKLLKKIGLSKDQFTINVSNKKILQGLINELKIEEDRQYKVLKSIDKFDRLGSKGLEE